MKFITILLIVGLFGLFGLCGFIGVDAGKKNKCNLNSDSNSKSIIPASSELSTIGSLLSSNSCVTFSVGSGTGCAWMCNYCAQQLSTSNYYFTNGVCTYDLGVGGCVGNPISGVKYTCCSA